MLKNALAKQWDRRYEMERASETWKKQLEEGEQVAWAPWKRVFRKTEAKDKRGGAC